MSLGNGYSAIVKVPRKVPLEGRYNGSRDFPTPLHFLSKQGDYSEDLGEQQVIKVQSAEKVEDVLKRKAGIEFPSSEMETATLEPVPREGIGVETAAAQLVSSLETAAAGLVPEWKKPGGLPIVSSKWKERD